MKNTLTGRAIVIGDTETFASGFYMRQLVIETDGKYPQTVPITFAKESADKMADKVSLGDPVEVDYDIRGREYNGKYYAEISGWRVKVLDDDQPEQRREDPPARKHESTGTFADTGDQGEGDDIPF